ncbi:MAG: sodium/proton antiporter NhaB [Venatoribacter sp.]
MQPQQPIPPRFFRAFSHNFLGESPTWYKQAILVFLVLNPLVLWFVGPVAAGWLLIAEFIFTLAMALQCYPLLPGGLLAIEAMLLGMTSPESLYHEVEHNLPVILLLMFMVAGIYFMKSLLLTTFTNILVKVRSKYALALLFCMTAAFLSAFLDALTVTAVVISVAVGFYSVYHRVASGTDFHDEEHDYNNDHQVQAANAEDLETFRRFLRGLLMHAAIGTALGGVTTMVGEPQNLLIAKVAGWDFATFFHLMTPVSMPVLVAGLITCVLLEKTQWFGYGTVLPESVYSVLKSFADESKAKRTSQESAALVIQAIAAMVLIFGLAFHIAEVGLIGLLVIIMVTALNGVTDEGEIGKAFEDGLPFTALLAVFFAIVAVIHDQELFKPIIQWVLNQPQESQAGMFYIANGVLSAISDNVFVATVYISEVHRALLDGTITREHFDHLAIAINTGTNLPSVATPNGQAAFLFLLTSAIAPLIRLSYGRMFFMALPYTIVMSVVGYICVELFL